MTSRQYREKAWQTLNGKYGIAILATFIATTIISFTSMSYPLGLLISGPITLGLSIFYLKIIRDEPAEVVDVFKGFEENFVGAFLLSLLTSLFTFLWSLLFIVPGIIKALAYNMAPYILADNLEMSASDAIKASMKMMDGNKGRLFSLYISFIGWFLLAMFTCGVGIIFLMPYVETARAHFYQDLLDRQTPFETPSDEPSDSQEAHDEVSHSVYI
jgi:uncharacterized membrane protein